MTIDEAMTALRDPSSHHDEAWRLVHARRRERVQAYGEAADPRWADEMAGYAVALACPLILPPSILGRLRLSGADVDAMIAAKTIVPLSHVLRLFSKTVGKARI